MAPAGPCRFNLVQEKNFPFLVALVIGIAVAVLVGFVVEFAFIKRFAKQPRLVLTVVSIALTQAIPGGSEAILRQVAPFIFPDQRSASLSELTGDYVVPLPLAGFQFHIGKLALPFGFQHVFALEAAIVGLAVLAVFFRYTRAGIAVRGVAENADRATLLGISVGSLSTLVWMLAAGLSGIGVIITGTLTTPAAATGGLAQAGAVFLPALAAAVLGRMRSIPLTVAAAVGISILRQAIEYTRPDDKVVIDGILFVIIAGGLILQRRRAGRSEGGAESSWQATQEQRPIPKELANVGGVRMRAFRAAGHLRHHRSRVPVRGLDRPDGDGQCRCPHRHRRAVARRAHRMGRPGQPRSDGLRGHRCGRPAARCCRRPSFPLVVVLIIAPVIVALVAVLVGLPALRIQGLFLAVTRSRSPSPSTPWCSTGATSAGCSRATSSARSSSSSTSAGRAQMYFLCVVALVVAIVLVINLRRSRVGRLLIAARENETNLESFGVNLVRTKLLAFAMSGALAGFAGVAATPSSSGPCRRQVVSGAAKSMTSSSLGARRRRVDRWGAARQPYFSTVIDDVVTERSSSQALVGPGACCSSLRLARRLIGNAHRRPRCRSCASSPSGGRSSCRVSSPTSIPTRSSAG